MSSSQRPTRGESLREWLFTLVGLAGIVIVLVLSKGDPNPIIVVALGSLAGRPIYSGIAEIVAASVARRNGNGNGNGKPDG